jgi:hypothetical protein
MSDDEFVGKKHYDEVRQEILKNNEGSGLKAWQIRARAKQEAKKLAEAGTPQQVSVLGYDPKDEIIPVIMQKKYCPILYWDKEGKCYTVGKLVQNKSYAWYGTYAVPGIFTHHTHNTEDRFINLIFTLNTDKTGEYLPEPDELYSVECSILKNVNEP